MNETTRLGRVGLPNTLEELLIVVLPVSRRVFAEYYKGLLQTLASSAVVLDGRRDAREGLLLLGLTIDEADTHLLAMYDTQKLFKCIRETSAFRMGIIFLPPR